MEIYLIRHTSPEIESGICYGQSNIDVAHTFLKEARQMKTFLPACFDEVYSSPLTRCKQLADFIRVESPVHEDARLMEMNFGAWEMKRWNEISLSELNPWMKDFVNVRAPGGENFSDLYQRAGECFDVLSGTEQKSIGIVTHAGVIRALIARVLEIPLKNAFKIPVSYASVTKLHIQTETCYCSLEFLNQV